MKLNFLFTFLLLGVLRAAASGPSPCQIFRNAFFIKFCSNFFLNIWLSYWPVKFLKVPFFQFLLAPKNFLISPLFLHLFILMNFISISYSILDFLLFKNYQYGCCQTKFYFVCLLNNFIIGLLNFLVLSSWSTLEIRNIKVLKSFISTLYLMIK